MRRALLSLAALLLAGSAAAQTTVVQTTTGFKMAGAPITVGLVDMTGVNASGSAIPFVDASGAGDGPATFACHITNGQIDGMYQPDGTVSGTCAVPDGLLTAPQISYQTKYCDTSVGLSTSGQCAQLGIISTITGTTYSLDRYAPPASYPTNQQYTYTTSTIAPAGRCATASQWFQHVPGATSGVLWNCGPDGIWYAMTGGGVAATIQMGQVATLPAGSPATAQNVGTSTNAVFNFGLPQGQAGAAGQNGANGTAATVTVNKVSTLAPGSQATVVNEGNSTNAVLDFGIPAGQAGAAGGGGGGTASFPTSTAPNQILFYPTAGLTAPALQVLNAALVGADPAGAAAAAQAAALAAAEAYTNQNAAPASTAIVIDPTKNGQMTLVQSTTGQDVQGPQPSNGVSFEIWGGRLSYYNCTGGVCSTPTAFVETIADALQLLQSAPSCQTPGNLVDPANGGCDTPASGTLPSGAPNQVLASPASGASGQATLRALTNADLPTTINLTSVTAAYGNFTTLIKQPKVISGSATLSPAAAALEYTTGTPGTLTFSATGNTAGATWTFVNAGTSAWTFNPPSGGSFIGTIGTSSSSSVTTFTLPVNSSVDIAYTGTTGVFILSNFSHP